MLLNAEEKMDLIQLKVKKDASLIKYVKIIREFDGSLSMGDIKQKIENCDFAVEFDLENHDVLEELNDIDRKREFRGMINKLRMAGADVSVYNNGDEVSLEFLDNRLETLDEIDRQTDTNI